MVGDSSSTTIVSSIADLFGGEYTTDLTCGKQSMTNCSHPDNWRQQTPAMRKCIGAGAGSSQHRLLFVRDRSDGAIEGTFRCFGQVDLHGELGGDRPVALTWKLRQPLPELVFESTSLILAG